MQSYLTVLFIATTLHVSQTEMLTSSEENVKHKFHLVQSTSRLLKDDTTGDYYHLLRAEEDTDDDVIARPKVRKRYMRFGRQFQRQTEQITSADKRYMRFGRQQQPGNDAIEHVASMTSLSRGNKEEHGVESQTQLDMEGRKRDSLLGKEPACFRYC